MRGQFVGIEILHAGQPPASAQFYAQVFGWEQDSTAAQDPCCAWADASARLRQRIFPEHPSSKFPLFKRMFHAAEVQAAAPWYAGLFGSVNELMEAGLRKGALTESVILREKLILVVQVDDLAVAADLVRRHGGTVAEHPTEDPQWGVSWLVHDPGGVLLRLVTARPAEPSP
jgi:predicted enzyme related to lactoylglutathione lyase